ncbi:helix-turn-helix domain-containing protein [Streptomyces sp. NPDC003635]
MSYGTAGDGFAALLRELKDRSGHSYGVLAKRLHMSTSTLHRYCNGDAVPTDYAPVERLARLCKASPEELVELHRRWVLADAMRKRKGVAGEGTSARVMAEEAPVEVAPVEETTAEEAPAEEAPAAELPEPPELPDAAPGPAALAEPTVPSPRRRLRRRSVVLAGAAGAVAVAAVLASVALATNPLSGDERQGDDARRRPVGAAASSDAPRTSAPPSKSPSPEAKSTPPASPSASRTTGGAAAPEADAGPPLTVTTRPYAWEHPCSQHYLIEQQAAKVPPPPFQQDAPAWVDAVGAVSAGEQLVTLTVQGTGEETVVLDSLTVHVVSKDRPLAWNDYVMGVGCGGGVPTRPFTVALDGARPIVAAAAGQRDFPLKVSESDPEVLKITADASAYDVRWYLELAWSSGGRSGKLVVDDGGEPFRTSGNNGRPAYEFPLGGEKWIASIGEGG